MAYRDDPAVAKRISESSRWLLQKAMEPAVQAMERDARLLAHGIWPNGFDSLSDMYDWLNRTYGYRRLWRETMNKLTLEWRERAK